ncbi:cystathionine gamma-synthase [Pseudaestuariivita atlantica]|uniref:Cystathionine gamma-synthase n=1 Tax=Pseudaestuariivita atlantica TaxID=1317121 RepID=A0A0L1JVI3_9RHOB|nr:cystathionine gamma-synthase [Pseudaestuariivita atlantica]
MRPDPLPASLSTPVVTPLMPSVVYASATPDELDLQYEGYENGYTYSREGHPNADVLAARIDRMEGGQGGVMTASGMAAVSAVLMGCLAAGDHVIGGDQLYGRSLRLMAEDLPRLGIETTLADSTDVDAIADAMRPNTKLVLIEVVSNPTLRIADLAEISALCRDMGVLLAVDNTFTTPALLKPFDHGADIVIHSVTKLLSGHSDVMAGYVCARDPDLNARLETFVVTSGMTPSPFDCWLGERGLLSFEVRLDRAQSTAARLADHLGSHPKVSRVLYPGRDDHPEAARAKALMGGQGGNMVSFVVPGGREVANAVARGAEGIAFAPTLGDVGTTLSHPASSSHRALTAEAREALGMPEGFFRVSVGLEDPDALIAVFDRALDGVPG